MLRPFLSKGCFLRKFDVTSYIPKDVLNLQTTCRSIEVSPRRILTTIDAQTLIDKPDLRRLLESGFYVDKTMYVQEILKRRDFCYIARPRKFGKTLFIETIASVCRGEKELFRDCHIGRAENGYEWAKYPVVKLDFSAVKKDTPEELSSSIENSLESTASEYGLKLVGSNLCTKFSGLVEDLACLGGDSASEVVVLIDDYDSPLLRLFSGSCKNAQTIKGLFTVLKSVQRHLKLIFVTGNTTFELFYRNTEANHFIDLTLDMIADGMFGFTKEELCNTFSISMESVAAEWIKSKDQKISESDIMDIITTYYNGYKFCKDGVKVYNPYSTMKFLAFGVPKKYWFDTVDFSLGSSTIISQIFMSPRDSSELDTENFQVEVSKIDLLYAEIRTDGQLWPSMFLAGYLTIHSYDESTKMYTMRFPNREVKISVQIVLLRYQIMYLSCYYDEKRESRRESILNALKQLKTDVFVDCINEAFSTIPIYVDKKEEQQFYDNLRWLLSGLELKIVPVAPCQSYVSGSGHPIMSIILFLDSIIYNIDPMYKSNYQDPLPQMRNLDYLSPEPRDGKTIVQLGLYSNGSTRRIDGWKQKILD